MKHSYKYIFWLVSIISCLKSIAQDSTGVSFKYTQTRISADSVLLSIKAEIKPGYILYALQTKANNSLYSSVEFDSSNKQNTGIIEKGNLQTIFDSSVKSINNFFTDTVLWQKKIAIKNTDSAVIKGTINYLVKFKDEYISREEKFKFYVHPENIQTTVTAGSIETKSLWWIFITAFLGGLLALLTPCVYSMIPVTVSFFTKRSTTKKEGIKNALYYAVSIIIIFTLFGFLVTLIFGPAALNNLATNWIGKSFFLPAVFNIRHFIFWCI